MKRFLSVIAAITLGVSSLSFVSFAAQKEQKPTQVVFEHSNSDESILIKNIDNTMKVSYDNQPYKEVTEFTYDQANRTVKVYGVEGGKKVNVIKKGNPPTTDNSDPVFVTVTVSPAPVVPQSNIVAPTSASNNDGKIKGLSASVEYKKDQSAEAWKSVTAGSTEITGLTGGVKYLLRTKGDTSKFHSQIVEVQIPNYTAQQKEATPTASFVAKDFDKGTLSNVAEGMKYSIDGGTQYIDVQNGQTTIELENVNPEKDIKVIKKATANNRLDSEAQVIDVTRADKPMNLVAEHPNTSANNNGKITGVMATMEYKKDSEMAWNNVSGTTIENLPAGNYQVRVKATGAVLASENQNITLNAYVAPPAPSGELQGTAGISGAAKFGEELTATLTGGNSNNLQYQWKRDGVNIASATTNKYVLVEADITKVISVEIKAADKTGMKTAQTTAVEKADGPTMAPTGITATAPTSATANDGKIMGVTPHMEYANNSAFTNPMPINNATITGLASGTYYVRLKATNTTKAGAAATVVVPAHNTVPTPPPTTALNGTASINGEAKFGKTLTAMLTGGNSTNLQYQWKRDGVNIPSATANTYVLVEADITKVISVEIKATDKTGMKTAQTVAVQKADGPMAPTGLTATKPTSATTNNGKISGVMATMEYANNSAFTNPMSITGTEILNLAAGTYYVRVKETATTKAGVAATVIVPAYNAPTPTPVPENKRNESWSSVRPDPIKSTKSEKTTDKKDDKTTKTTRTLKDGESRLQIGSRIAESMRNGKAADITMDAAPFIQNGRTMVPLRYVAELLGLKVEWLPATRTAKLTGDKVEILVPVNKTTMMVNGKAVESDIMPILTGSRTYLSISNIAKALGLEEGKNIIWDNDAKEVLIKK